MSLRGWMLFAAMSVIWGIPYLLIKIAVEGVSVPVLVLARTAIGAAVLLPLALSRVAWAPVLRHWRPVLVFAFFEIIAAWLLLSWCVPRTRRRRGPTNCPPREFCWL